MLAKLAPSLGAVAALTVSGLALQALLPKPLERGAAARLGLAYLLGCAWVGLGAWAMGFLLGAPLATPLFVALVSLPALAAAGAIARRGSLGGLARAPESAAGRARDRWPAVAVGVVVVAQSLALLAHTTAEPVTDFDGRMTWGTQAKYLRAAASVLPAALLDEEAFVIHPRYPIVLPILQVATTALSGLSLESFGVRPLYVLFLPALATALWPALRRTGGSIGAALSAVLVLTAPLLLADSNAGPRGTFSDFPLAVLLGAGLALLLHPRARSEPWRGWPAGLLFAAAAGAKNEGMLLATAALAACWWVSSGRRRSGAAARAAIVLALALALIVAWRIRIPNRNDEGYFEQFSAATIVARAPEQVATIASEISTRSLDRASWGWLFWVAPPLVMLGARGLRRRAARAAALVVAAELVLATAAYSAVGYAGVIAVTWNRFVLQISAPIAILLAAAAGAVASAVRARAPARVARSREARA